MHWIANEGTWVAPTRIGVVNATWSRPNWTGTVSTPNIATSSSSNVTISNMNIQGTVTEADPVSSTPATEVAEYLRRVLEALHKMDEDILEISDYEDTLREKVERDIKANTCDAIVAVLSNPLR